MLLDLILSSLDSMKRTPYNMTDFALLEFVAMCYLYYSNKLQAY